MKNFTYYRPTSPEQAMQLLEGRWGSAELLAGGTDLLDLQKEYIAQPDKVISTSRFLSSTIVVEGSQVSLGAGARLADIAADRHLRQLYPALTTAAGDVGGPQIRNMGTLGGNLCQRNRCWYFRDEHVHCLLKGGDKCYALDGDNRYHAIFTQGHKCVIVHPSTLAPVLIALGASAEIIGPQGKRTVEVAKLFQAPSSAAQREHVLASNEIILSVTIPRHKQGDPKNASCEVRHKQSWDWPLAQAAVALRLDGGKATGVKIVLGHVAPTPHLAEEAARALEGKEVTEDSATAAGEAAVQGAKPLAHNAYKLKLASVAVKRAVLTASGHKKYWEV